MRRRHPNPAAPERPRSSRRPDDREPGGRGAASSDRRAAVTPARPAVSVVAPVYNERENLPILYRSVRSVLVSMRRPFEMVFVDDGSTDGTRDELKRLARRDPLLRAVLFRRNFGQSAAMAAGFRASRGAVVVTLDGDLQNDPRDIPALVGKLEEGYDVVSGWRKERQDTLFLRKVPSRIANRLICSVTDVRLHDTGCSLKAFRREVIDQIRLYGELHRFLPALARVEGARIAEIVVRHHPRRFGRSKYNLTRTFRVLMDLSSLNVFLKYLRNPLRFFGKIGILFFGLGAAAAAWAAVRFASGTPLLELNVALTLVFLFFVAGFQWLFLGAVASLIVATGGRRGAGLSALGRHDIPRKD
jgi:glycosyltransferase involved in cell wall biosynthesis